MRTKAKVSGSVVAGFPSPAEQYLEPPLDLNELLVKRPAATYFVRVQGDSMIGAGISDGDLLVVDRSMRPADGDVIIASVDGDFTVKTLRVGGKREQGRENREQGRGNREQGRGNREQGRGNRGGGTESGWEYSTRVCKSQIPRYCSSVWTGVRLLRESDSMYPSILRRQNDKRL